VPQERTVLRLPVSRVESVALAPGSDELIVAGPPEEGGLDRVSVSSWKLRLGTPLRARQIRSPREVWASTLSPDGRTLATDDAGRTLRVWDVAEGSPKESVHLPETVHYGLAMFDGLIFYLTIISGDKAEPATLDIRSGPGSLRVRGDIQETRLAHTLQGERLILGSDRSLFRWDLATDEVTRVEQPRFATTHWLNVLTISRDDRHLASGRNDNSIQLWDARTLEWEATLLGHPTGVGWLDFSPDGKTLASASDDGTVKLWDIATRQELMTLERVSGDADGRRHLRFSPDGSSLVYCFTHQGKGYAIVWSARR
jgi:WD40 repeat protein